MLLNLAYLQSGREYFLESIMPRMTPEEIIDAQNKIRESESNGDWLRQSLEPHLMSPEELYRLSPQIAAKIAEDESKGFFGHSVVADYLIVILIVVGVIAALYFFMPAFRSFGKSTDLARMIQKYKGDYMNPQLVGEIYEYCCRHEFLSPIVRKHNADIGSFTLIYLTLLAKCPASAKGHFLPISTFFFAASLDYVLSKNALSDADIL